MSEHFWSVLLGGLLTVVGSVATQWHMAKSEKQRERLRLGFGVGIEEWKFWRDQVISGRVNGELPPPIIFVLYNAKAADLLLSEGCDDKTKAKLVAERDAIQKWIEESQQDE